MPAVPVRLLRLSLYLRLIVQHASCSRALLRPQRADLFYSCCRLLVSIGHGDVFRVHRCSIFCRRRAPVRLHDTTRELLCPLRSRRRSRSLGSQRLLLRVRRVHWEHSRLRLALQSVPLASVRAVYIAYAI